MKIFFFLLLIITPVVVHAQLGFCQGSKGDPIFHEDFGQGFNTGPPLANTTTNYNYVTGDPNDGEYTISGRIGQNNLTWHNSLPSTTISKGKALIVNADFTSGLFYTTPISGLCENSSYEFSAYLMNVYNPSSQACPNGGIPVNVRFEIWNSNNTILLKQGSTGNIVSTSNPRWQQYALTFQSGPDQSSVILKMFNNGVGGCGNDLAIDDILFSSCGDLTEISSGRGNENPYIICESSASESVILTATPDHSIYKKHFFQWQQSDDGTTWENLTGETMNSYILQEATVSKFYRVKVAEEENNLNNNLCSTVSKIFEIKYIPAPQAPLSGGDANSCSNEEIPLLYVTVGEEETVNWYDAASGGNLLKEGSVFYQPETEGTFYAEALNRGGCSPSPRTPVTFTAYNAPEVENEILDICEGGSLLLNAGIEDVLYEWSTGENGREIIVDEAGDYCVKVTTSQGCSAIKNFMITMVVKPEIYKIVSGEEGITILTNEGGNFLYSLDGIDYQESGFFGPLQGGVYTAFVRDINGCNTVSSIFPHIVIQRFFTPNGDGYNDFLELAGVEYFNSSFIRVFNRYGKLIKAGEGETFSWDGTFEGKALPPDDYWYEISIEGFKALKGHISLLR